MLNLRGVREAGIIFIIPTNLFAGTLGQQTDPVH
jgi:hypothetical protein